MILYKKDCDGFRQEIADPILNNSVVLCGSFNPLHEGHLQLMHQAQLHSGKNQIIYEISALNIDKGEIDEKSINDRIEQFDKPDMNVLVTKEPYFYKKALMIPNSAFVVGYDTYIRLIDIKYYMYSIQELERVLSIFKNTGTSILVAGRLNQSTNLFEYLDELSIRSVSEQYRDIFQPIKEFRVDISSTELRKLKVYDQ
ncbi:uncharacterized protein loc101305073 [Stylonychia lemnae]|uniref:Uncharacterized protein loc101305073 n=1 Tax=Stylonychia lemnae TaxID=5949 RepID=A0A078B3S1_STYLE|nr:uncharacterized protein loc101305073 [Stylonychia lemnae]|eukprot:CDW89124.1 uncharacterized protein loc101305073 [Stylonychia lemnae]